MQRRDFLKHTVGTGIVGAGTLAGCATTGVHAPALLPPQPVDMDAYVAQMDSCLAAIRNGAFAETLLPLDGTASSSTDDSLRRETLTRKVLSTMTITGMCMDLEEQDRTHPAMQARLWGSVAEMDDAVWGVHDLLTSMPETDRQNLRHALRRDPTLMGGIADAIDAKAELIQMPTKRRLHLKRLIGQVGWRLREQDPSLLFDDVATKVSRVAQRGAQAVDPNVTTMSPVMIAPVPQQQQQYPQYQQYQYQPEDPRVRQQRLDRRRSVGTGLLIGGGAAMGLGAVAFGVGVALVSGGSSMAVGTGLVMGTVGAILLVAGLIVLIIGLVRYARSG